MGSMAAALRASHQLANKAVTASAGKNADKIA
jgi:hypothetical protein